MLLHARIIRHKLDVNAFLGNLLVQLYGHCGALNEASAVFALLPHRDHFAWNFLIRSYAASCPLAEPLLLYQRMLLEGILPDRFILVGILSACTSNDDILVGKLFHSCIAGGSLELDTVIGTAFMNMYAKCGSLEDAQRCFDKLLEQDTVSCNAMIAAFEQYGDDKNALQLFNQMQQQSVSPERVTFLNTLSACSSEDFLPDGKRLHACCMCTEFKDHLAVETALVSMYGKCHSVEDARRTFDTMIEHDVVSWNALIAIYAQHKQIKEALHLFEEMRREGVMPDPITFICILDACGNQGVLLDEEWIQVNIKGTAAGLDMEVGMAVMTMYSNCGYIKGAWETFHAAPNRSIAFWNTMVSAFVKDRKLDSALQLLSDMYQHGVVPNKFTYSAILDACLAQMALDEGQLLHMCLVENHFECDAVIIISVINLYSKSGRLDEAYRLFQSICERTVVSWNVIISGYAEQTHDWETFQLFQQMLHEGILPNHITFLCILDVCSDEAALNRGKRIHSCIMATECELNAVLQTALVTMYGKCGSPFSAQRVFNNLPERDTVAWSAMISALVQGGQSDEAFVLFARMLEEGGIPDLVTYASILCAFLGQAALSQGKQVHARLGAVACELDVIAETSLICMYCKCGSVGEAWRLFNERRDKSVASWNALMCGLTQSGHRMSVFQLQEQMRQEGLLPSNLTFVSILESCSSDITLTKGHQIHSNVISCNLAGDAKVETALLNMYAKCGSLKDAEMVFSSMFPRNIMSWTAIIAANAQHGNGKNAIRLFRQMLEEGHVPKAATFVSIFSACSHAGLVDELKELLGSLSFKNDLSLGLDLYNCTIDLLGRAGRLDEAEALIGSMPHDPTVVSWTTLLGACKYQVDVERGERAAKQLLRLDSQNAEPYVALSNIYAAAGRGEEAQMVFDWIRRHAG